MATVFETVRSAADELRAAGVDTPQHDAKLLLAEAFHTDLQHVDKAMLMGDGVERLAEKEDAEPAMERFQTMLARRVKREPLQHITGHAPFRYLDLKVGPGVFIPRPETELVVQEGVDWATRNGMYRAKVVDLCAGSGAIGLAFASEVPGSEVWAVEKSATTAEWTRRNLDETAKRYPAIAGNYHLDIADATQMPTLSQLDGTIDIVLTNPPYVPLAGSARLRPRSGAIRRFGGRHAHSGTHHRTRGETASRGWTYGDGARHHAGGAACRLRTNLRLRRRYRA